MELFLFFANYIWVLLISCDFHQLTGNNHFCIFLAAFIFVGPYYEKILFIADAVRYTTRGCPERQV